MNTIVENMITKRFGTFNFDTAPAIEGDDIIGTNDIVPATLGYPHAGTPIPHTSATNQVACDGIILSIIPQSDTEIIAGAVVPLPEWS
jgi:hypothetical protein